MKDDGTPIAMRITYSAPSPSDPLYRQVLGADFDRLPKQVQAFHDSSEGRLWSGQADVRRGANPFAKVIAKIIGFPKAGPKVPVSVALIPQEGGEKWTRNFDGAIFSSMQKRGIGKDDHLLVEQFGIVQVALALVVEADKLRIIPRRWSCLGLPLPPFLLPSGNTFEADDGSHFCFDVEISVPLIGLIVSYKGVLKRS